MVVGSLTVDTDVVVIGGGPGGYVAAIRLAQLGKDVVLVEAESRLGGVCLNSGCIPTKSLITASNYYNKIADMKDAGVVIEKYSIDVKKMFEWKDGILNKLDGGIKGLCTKYGIEVITGKAVFTSANSVRIEGKSDVNQVNFKHAIVATGSSPLQIPGFVFDGKFVWSSTEALSSAEVPKKLAIVGGGYIGTEMGTVYGKLGSEVHIIEPQDRLIGTLDAEIVQVVANALKKFNVTAHLGTKPTGMKIEGGQVILDLETKEGKSTMVVDKVLVVVGRKPCSKNMGLEAIGIQIDDRGFIKIDDQCRTNIKNIFAVGDVSGQPMLAHRAQRQGKVAAEVIAGLPSAFDNKVIPFVVFNDPELLSVGLTKENAIAKGYDIMEAKFPFGALAKSLIIARPEGFIKVIAEKKTHVVLGIHAVGPNVSELAGECALAMEMGATVDDLSLTIHPHPTVSESIVEGADAVLGNAVHIFVPKH